VTVLLGDEIRHRPQPRLLCRAKTTLIRLV
jgi:hypothetical protein